MHIAKVKPGLSAIVCCAVLCAAIVLSAPAANAAQCGKSDKVIAFLGKKYKEQIKGMGLVGNKGFMQLFVAETGTWTVLLTTPEGVSCIVAAGDSFETTPMVALDPNA